MSNDLQIIQELEKALNTKIPKLKQNTKIEYDIVGYTLNNQNKVDGLGLKYCKLQNEHLHLIGKLTSLDMLDLGCNEISKIEELNKLTNLQVLGLLHKHRNKHGKAVGHDLEIGRAHV